PTLAYQIASHVPHVWKHMEQTDRIYLSQAIRTQFLTLIAEPLKTIRNLNRSIVIINGLDECASINGVVQLIAVIRETMDLGTPLRFLLTSRPEREIEHAFHVHMSDGTSLQRTLKDSEHDIRLHLQTELTNIWEKFGYLGMQCELQQWLLQSVES